MNILHIRFLAHGKIALVFAMLLVVLTMKGQSGTLPVMHIETLNHQPITSKVTYIPGTYYIVDNLNPDNNVGSETEPMDLEIRGRGNSSWKADKKPYKIKLAEKTKLLGMKKHKHWALLKFSTPTVAGMQLGNIMGMDWTPSTKPLEVVLNGDFIGLYLLTETNRIGKNRLDIYEQPNWNHDPYSIPYGWLVEVDNYADPDQIRIPENDKWTLRITYHSPDSLSRSQEEWLVDEFTAINAAIYEEDKIHSTWEQQIDVDAMARYFIIQEVLDNSDGFHGSFYLHKDWTDSARWVAGPLWDLACNQRQKTDYTFKMKTSYGFTPHWIGELIKDEDFCSTVRNAWREFYPHEIQSWMNYIDDHLLFCGQAYELDKARWNYTNQKTLQELTDQLKAALIANIEWFNDNLPVGMTASINGIYTDCKKAVKVEYLNTAGMHSSQPWIGVNIKVTTYDDGSTSTSKIVIAD